MDVTRLRQAHDDSLAVAAAGCFGPPVTALRRPPVRQSVLVLGRFAATLGGPA